MKRHRMVMTAALALAALPVDTAGATPVVLISIDGLMPDYYLHPDDLGLKTPNLRMLVQSGAYAIGATSVMPSVTFPSHSTIITGVSPRKHGVLNNTIFDPDGSLGGGWHYYYTDLKVPTLFDAARKASLKTAAVSWPVTGGGPIDLNLPDMYPVQDLRAARNLVALMANSESGRLLADVLPPPEGLIRMQDDVRVRATLRFLEQRPDFLALHLLELDHEQHVYGPRTPQAIATLEKLDGYLGRIFDALKDAGRWDATAVVLVSDHGFAPIEKVVHVAVLMRAMGLIDTGADGKVTGWRAMPWAAGGTAAIYLHPSAGADDRRKVDALVTLLIGDTSFGVKRAIRDAALVATGGYAGAYLVLEARRGFQLTASLQHASAFGTASGGAHGYDPLNPEMRASFVVKAPDVKPGSKLGLIRLADVAPTIAKILGVDIGVVDGRNILRPPVRAPQDSVSR